jgi:hypothetical protein
MIKIIYAPWRHYRILAYPPGMAKFFTKNLTDDEITIRNYPKNACSPALAVTPAEKIYKRKSPHDVLCGGEK